MFRLVILVSLLLIPHFAEAAFKLNRTRVVYSQNNGQELIVSNNSSQLYGGQVWVENYESNDKFYFVTSPQLFKIKGNDKQVIRIFKTDEELPGDQESLFWINVQEIPPKSSASNSALVMSFRTKIKLIYRPETILEKRNNAEQQLTWRQQENTVMLNNPTAFYFAITSVEANGTKHVPHEKQAIAPFSTQLLSFDSLPQVNELAVIGINDYGANRRFVIEQDKNMATALQGNINAE
ncbi:fimbria/pilus periplasmic chaperone [Shewanella youngdeokensis]|uniref:Fimbria/pilus periplasmic chaperone n=1 Tax=Shewanella youngdeokensis TaxID=2999068 RepID=A0ABZ0K2X9_9GAMM|nr:fimbria/pilus periplasmic chaperone [Shewanella sp. DAU334]